jgi:hypothetical protein
MSNDVSNDLVFYCPQHQLRFRATGDGVVTCEQGGHSVGHGFPEESWWEYCCDCATFWPSQVGNGYLRRSECLVCERPTAKRYVCEACQVVSIESAALVKRKLYSITIENGICRIAPDVPNALTQFLQNTNAAKSQLLSSLQDRLVLFVRLQFVPPPLRVLRLNRPRSVLSAEREEQQVSSSAVDAASHSSKPHRMMPQTRLTITLQVRPSTNGTP